MTFKTIEIAPNFEINEDGIVRNKRTGHVYIHQIHHQGYPWVGLYVNGKQKKVFIHRALANAFIPNPNNFDVVMHIDDDTSNYSLSNLKWGTQKHNMEQSSATGHYSTMKKSVTLISPTGEIVEVTGLRTFCAEQGLDWGNFQKVVKGKHNSVKGWKRLAINDC